MQFAAEGEVVFMSEVEHNEIVAQLAALVGEQQRSESPMASGLEELVAKAASHVPGTQFVGMTVASRTQGISTAAATHPYAKTLDEIQQRHQEGPCLSAAWEHHTVRIDDLKTEQRWPLYCIDALAETPVRSVLAFEVFVNDDILAALNFYSEHPRAFEQESIELGIIFATHTALAWSMFRRNAQFRSALASRDLIGQAKGILMNQFNVDAVRAFELLTRLSQDSNTKLVDIAKQIVDNIN
ncbi:GAF and ANTAR domain-containing protein [Mycolicibacterium hippocampi]|uniref:Transcriptional regulator n=1 Tax=Mycolicibacterium hippocampi TaxID=659824 RepID=A0A7I9ZP75_9MYCO|nr:GAF and ANTAR domain-containing protein [Mycolicibacterium hippocampi]GFH02860.1 transcriptional regulator [Mycolicibacterium hippocampi]